MISVYIVDDHPSIVHGVQNMLKGHPDIAIRNTYTSGKDLLVALENELPDLILLDIQLPDYSGNQLARIISNRYPQVGLLAFTNMNSEFHIKDLMNHGCLGYLLKTADTTTLIEGIQTVFNGKTFLDQLAVKDLSNKMSQNRKKMMAMPSLTKREREILELICFGRTSKEIAKTLYLSLRTVENHRFNLQQKLNVKSVAELIRVSLQVGWVSI